LGRRGIAGLIGAAVLGLTVVVLFAVRFLSGDLPISIHGYLAMAAATVGLCIVTGGLMWLAFYSSRAGWDDIDREP
jgi:hypothetical protein